MSQQGLFGLTNPFVTCESSFGFYIWVGSDSVFLTVYETKGLCGLTNPFVTCESSSGGYFWVGSDLGFLDYFWINRSCGCWRIHGSALETISVMISKRGATQFSVTLFESIAAMCADESTRYLCKQFGGLYWQGIDLVFRNSFWVKRGCVGWRIHSSPVKGVLSATFEWAATLFSLTVYESTGAVWADESIRHLWKQFRVLYLRGQRLSFSDCLWDKRGCVGWRIHSSRAKGVSRATSEWIATKFSVTVYE